MASAIVKSVATMNVCKNTLQIGKRLESSVASKLVFTEFGDPGKVLHKENVSIGEPKENEVLLKVLAAPVNPVDINVIQGKYPLKPAFPAVPGSEGVAFVVKTGPKVLNLTEGDHVIPLKENLGFWRTHFSTPEENLLRVPKTLGLVEAATLTINPCTAYRMLKDYSDLKPGDTVIQNGANSACGQNVIQLCRYWGINTVNVVRNRPNLEELKNFLTDLGATYVLTEEELRLTNIFKTGKIAKPKLALDCVGGKSALEILRHLQDGSKMVTYGGMSREPVQLPTSALIFKDLHVYGFRITLWTQRNEKDNERFKMFRELISMMVNKDLKGPVYKMVDFEDYKEALTNTMTLKGMTGQKYILGFDLPKSKI